MMDLNQYMREDAQRWAAVHARITSHMLMLVGVIEELGPNEKAKIISSLRDLDRTIIALERHPAARQDVQGVLGMLNEEPDPSWNSNDQNQ